MVIQKLKVHPFIKIIFKCHFFKIIIINKIILVIIVRCSWINPITAKTFSIQAKNKSNQIKLKFQLSIMRNNQKIFKIKIS